MNYFRNMLRKQAQKGMEAAMQAHMTRGERMAPQAQEAAERFAEEHNVGLDQVGVMATPFGQMKAFLIER